MMKTNVPSLAKRLLILIGLCVLCVMPIAAQDTRDPDAAYQEALRRIEEARVSGATELDLCLLGLKTIPPEIGELTHLEVLCAGYNYLPSLPSEISQLSSLRVLEMEENQLRSMPLEITQLTNLQWLRLSYTHLTSLPPEIAQLTSLQVLRIEENQLTELPLELGNLPQLTELYLDGNLLTFPPPEILAQGTPAILAYLRDYEAMLMRQTIAGVAAGIGGIALVILAFRWRQRRAFTEKKKRF